MSESEGKMMEKDLELRNFKRRYETLEEINKNMEKRLARVEEEVRDKQRQVMDKVQKEIDESKKKVKDLEATATSHLDVIYMIGQHFPATNDIISQYLINNEIGKQDATVKK